uniref:YqgF/RNase H-like domain-containing protein n=1 Tax=Parascaris univalens TaxID=6257 RepID=A0A915C6Q6_PARUN
YLGIKVSVVSSLSKKAKSLKKDDKDFPLLEHFKLYTSFDKDARFVQPFQVLALERASSKGIINWKVRVDDRIGQYHPAKKLRLHDAHLEFLKNAVRDSTKRFLIPTIERSVRRRLLDKAERSAIDCFAKNMRELLLTAPLKGHLVLAIDPGYSSGCKCALVDNHFILPREYARAESDITFQKVVTGVGESLRICTKLSALNAPF